MKKSVKIILIVVGVLVIAVAYFGYTTYQMVQGSEDITGNQDKIPSEVSSLPEITKGADDWPNWRGNNFEGKSATIGIKKDWSKGLKKLWNVDFLCQDRSTASWATPVVQGNRIIVPGRDEKNDLVFCLNSENGKLIWQGSYEAISETSHGPGARATPFIDDSFVYTYGRSGDLACWQLADGKLLWKKNVKDEGGQEPDWGLSGTPLVFKDKVIVQGGGKALVIAYDKITGEVIWKSMEGQSGYSAIIPITLENIDKILIYHSKGLSCLNPEDGKELWNAPWETDYGVNATTPILHNDIIFHTSGYGMGAQAIMAKLDSYEVLWKSDVIAAHHSDPVLVDGYLYGYSGQSTRNKGDFKCVELSSGKEIWTTDELGQGTCSYVDGHLICLDLKGNLFLVKADPTSFQKVAEIEKAIENVKSLVWTSPIIANGKLYLRYMQQLICYDLMK